MGDTPKIILCPCGFTLHGSDDDEVVAAAQAHAREIHEQRLSREQALGMARPAS
jgi:predicted small metal-binding protein